MQAVTWRGMVTKLMLAVYDTEQAIQRRRTESWEMNVMLIDVSGLWTVQSCRRPVQKLTLPLRNATHAGRALPRGLGDACQARSQGKD